MSITVFLADDHTVVREGLRALLEAQKNISVVGEAADGREAVRQVSKIRPDVVILDIAMPDLNGIEATKQISKNDPGTRVVILSMHAGKENIFRALNAGAQGYLLKESAGQEVIKAIHAVHAGGRYLSQRITETLVEDYLSLQVQPASGKSPMELLSSREREILQLVVEGKSSAEIAETLYLSPKTVETYRSRLMKKLDVNNLPSLVKFAIRHGVTSLDG